MGPGRFFYLAVSWMKMHAGLMTCEARAAARFGTIGPPQDHCEPNANRLSAARRGVRVLSKRCREYPVLWGVPTIHRRLRPVRYGVLTLRRGLRPVRRGVPRRVSYVVHWRHKQCFVR